MISVEFMQARIEDAAERSVAMTPLGSVAVEAYSDGTVAALTLDATPADDDTERFVPLIHRILDALADPEKTATFRIAPRVGGLQIDVMRAIAGIPQLSLASYSRIARMAGRRQAVRAVATAVGRNPLPLLVPCHRVVPAAVGRNIAAALAEPSRLGQYTPSVALKTKILDLEGYFVDKNLPKIKFLS